MTRISIADDCSGSPTLDDINRWPATVAVPTACRALGVSPSHGYELIKTGEFPVRVLKVGGRLRVVTASIVALLRGAEVA